MVQTLLILAGVVLLTLVPLAWQTLRAYLKFRETRVVTCPETGCPATVNVDEKHAAASTWLRETEVRLSSCSRWPERKDCGQECLAQLEMTPEDRLVRNMLISWYRGSTCAVCETEIPEIRWSDHKPAIVSPDGQTLDWSDVKPEDLRGLLVTYRRVCWACLVAQSFWKLPGLAPARPDPTSVRRAS